MDSDCLKLTSYFGERDRVDGVLLSDRLLDLFGEQRVLASVLLRGAEGFGARQHTRTDRLLTLSEDLPVVSIAVDRRERIEALLDRVLSIKRRGLLTLERARVLDAGADPDVRAGADDIDAGVGVEGVGALALSAGPREASKLTIYVGRHERIGRAPAFVAITDLLHSCGFSGVTVLLGVDGTRSGQRLRARFLARNVAVPVMIVAIGSRARIADALPRLQALPPGSLMTLERVRVCKRDGELLAVPHELPGTDEHGLALWQRLTVYSSQAATHEGRPLSLEIVRRLRAQGAAGATSLRGVWGFHGAHAPHGDRLLQVRRHVPVVTSVIDTPERIASAFAVIDELTAERGLVTSEMVPAVMVVGEDGAHAPARLARHDY